MALAAHPQQMDVENRCRLAGFSQIGEFGPVAARRCVDVIAEGAVAGRHRVDVAGRDVDTVQQRLAGLFLVSVVVIAGDEAVISPEQVHPRPVHRMAADPGQQTDPGAAAGEHNPCAAAGRDGRRDRAGQAVTGRGHQCVGVRVGLYGHAHGQEYRTFSIPASASW